MSLTRDEWCKMWESIKIIERASLTSKGYPKAGNEAIDREVAFIKKLIQSVIGQME